MNSRCCENEPGDFIYLPVVMNRRCWRTNLVNKMGSGDRCNEF
jgi:hypothetical protein